LARYDRIGIALPNKDTHVFDRENGEPWNVNELATRWSRLVRRSKLPHIRLHDLRHAFASLAHDAGPPIHSIAETMGHASIGVTSATHVHLFDDARRQRAEKLDQLIKDP
jgi:integrase